MDENHKYILAIPLNIESLDGPGDLEIPFDEIQFEDFFITKGDYENLFDLFTEFNKAFNIIIDEYEEEIIPAGQINSAITLSEQYFQDNSQEIKASTEKLLVALRRAKELQKELIFFF